MQARAILAAVSCLSLISSVVAPCVGQATSMTSATAAEPSSTARAAPKAPLELTELQVPPLPSDLPAIVPTDRPISLDEAIGIALANEPQLALAQHTSEAARGRARQAASALYPTLSVAAEHTRTGPAVGGQAGGVGSTFTVGGYTTDLSARELIYDFGKTPGSVGQARSQAESARQALAQARQDVVNQVKQAYYTLLQNQELVAVQQRTLADQRAHFDLATARFDAGVAPRVDVVRAEAAVADAVLNLATAENSAAVSRINLNLALGADVRTPTKVQQTEEPAPLLPDAGALVEQAFASRPAVQQVRAGVAAAQHALAAARATNLPAVVLNGNYGLRGSSFPPDDGSWSYGVSLQWPLVDVGLTRGRVQEAEANLLVAQTQLRQQQDSVASQVVQAYLNTQTAGQKVTAAESSVASAEESLRLAVGRYESGVAAYLEVIDAETAAITARVNLVNARYGLSTALASLEQALGIEYQAQAGPRTPGAVPSDMPKETSR